MESGAQRVVIATDHESICQAAQRFGAQICMTGSHHQSGTDRLAEVVDSLRMGDDEVLVNLQGDEPCMPGHLIRKVALLLDDQTVSMGTLAAPIHDVKTVADPHVVKVVTNRKGFALYFSRAAIPFDRDANSTLAGNYFKHIGIYAYRAGFLRRFIQWPPADIERTEKLEQLRALWQGVDIKVAVTDEVFGPGVDTMEELHLAGQWLQSHTFRGLGE